MKLTGLPISFGIMQFFLDGEHFNQHLRRLIHNYEGQPDLDFLLARRLAGKTGMRFPAASPQTPATKKKRV